MKNTFAACLLLLLCTPALRAQIKFDYNWMLGRPSSVGDTSSEYNGTRVDFNTDPASYYYFQIRFDMDANAAISDSAGGLLFYTNGCGIINRHHTLMLNGEGINEGGWVYETRCGHSEYPMGYPTHQGLMILPWPDRPDYYIMPHIHKGGNSFYSTDLLYTVVDMRGDGGLGEVVAKNQPAVQDTLLDMLTAVRHANGRDWWIVVPKYNSDIVYTFLLSPEGIGPARPQAVGRPIDNRSWGMQAVFSPDGEKYVNGYQSLQVFDFDRCSGRLSNRQDIDFPGDTVHACGVAVSPNSRYLYAAIGSKLYQYDFLAPDLAQSRKIAGVYDGFKYDVLLANFYQMMLAPDGKIYMTCGNGMPYWHIIHRPNSRGSSCDLEQHFELPTLHSFSPPNFPHFRLFDLPGSPCDSLGIDGPQPPRDTLPPPLPPCAEDLRVAPNPAAYLTLVTVPACVSGSLWLYDAQGRLVQRLDIPPAQPDSGIPLDLSELPAGIYFLRVETPGGQRLAKRLAVVR